MLAVRRSILALVSALMIVGPAVASPVLPDPYEMVRSLRNLQDKVAAGKTEALPLLRLLLVRIGRQFREIDPKKWSEARNQYAAVTYLLNGGNPDVVRAVLGSIKGTAETEKILEGAFAYAEGDPASVLKAFAGLKPGTLPFDLLDSIYLVSAAPLAEKDPLAAMGRLDYVRLTAPGSLLEEAAIRRSLSLAGKLGKAWKLRLMARDYLLRFGHSPYLEDFLQQLVQGVVLLKGKITDDQIAEMASFAPDRVRLSLYLRLARGELLGGQPHRAQFAAHEAEDLAKKFGTDSVQAKLYAAVGGVTTSNVEAAVEKLSMIPRKDLHPADVGLLDAAQTLAREITGPPVTTAPSKTDDSAAPILVNMPAIEDTPGQKSDLAAFDATVGKAKAALSQVDKLLGGDGK